MKKFAALLTPGFLALACGAAAGPVMDVTVSSDMAAVDFTQRHDDRGSLWSLGLGRNSEVDATTASLTYNAVGNLMANKQVRAGIGWKGGYHDTFQRSFSLALGGFVRYEPAGFPGVGLEGVAYYAPDVLSTNDAERYRELMARVTYNLHSRASVFAGWAEESLRYEPGAEARDVEFVDGLVAGISISF